MTTPVPCSPARDETVPKLNGFVAWPEEQARLYRDRGYWEGLSIADVIERLAHADPDREAIFDGVRRISRGQLWEESGRLAVHFVHMGLKPLDRVVFQLPNNAEFVVAFLALMRIGVIPVMALPPHRRTEIQHFVLGSQAVGLLIPSTLKDFYYRLMAEEIRSEAPSLRHVLVLGDALSGQVSISDLIAKPVASAEVVRLVAPLRPHANEVALMLLSGGTTALPKMIARTHNDYIYNFKKSGSVAGMDADSVLLIVLPMGHNFGLGSPGVLGALAHGGRAVIISGRDIESVFGLIEQERVTTCLLTPPLAIGWIDSPLIDRANLSSLRNVLCGGARMPPEIRAKARQRLGCFIQECYGNAEGLLSYVRLNDDPELQMESSGTPICPDDEIKVVDELGIEVADGETGELLVRGPYTIRGYYNNPDADSKAFTKDGFYRTGDVVYQRKRYIYHRGRIKELINRGGEKISCPEVEDHILDHPAVANVVLVAMPDPTYGEKACACVILKEDASGLTLGELNKFLLAREIAKFKLPERLELVDSFPLSPAGKILRRQLRGLIEERLESERVSKN